MTKKTLQNVVLYAYKAAICYETEEHNRYKVWYTILSNQEFIEIIKLYSHFITQNNKSITEDKLRKILIDVCGEEYLHYKMSDMYDSPIKPSSQTCRQGYLEYRPPKKNDENSEISIQQLMNIYIETKTSSYIFPDNSLKIPANCQKLFNDIDELYSQKTRSSPLKNQRNLKTKEIKKSVDDGELDALISEPTCQDFFLKMINNVKKCCYGTDNNPQIIPKLEWQEFITQLLTYKIIQKS